MNSQPPWWAGLEEPNPVPPRREPEWIQNAMATLSRNRPNADERQIQIWHYNDSMNRTVPLNEKTKPETVRQDVVVAFAYPAPGLGTIRLSYTCTGPVHLDDAVVVTSGKLKGQTGRVVRFGSEYTGKLETCKPTDRRPPARVLHWAPDE